MSEFTDALSITTNFITSPDFVDDTKHSVLLIDPTSETVDALAEWCKTADKEYNVYLYREDTNDPLWLDRVTAAVDAIIINTVPNDLSSVKEFFITTFPKAWYYGPRRYIQHPQRLHHPQKYFENQETQ